MSYLAEQNVIGSLLVDKDCMDSIYNTLSANMFTSELLGSMYREFQKGYDNRYDVTPATILQNVESDKYPEQVVLDEIKNCALSTVTSASVKSYASVVINEYKARQLNAIFNSIRVSANGIDTQIGTVIANLEALQEGKKAASKTLAEIVEENQGKYFVDNEGEKIYTGFPKMDDLLGSLEGGDMIVIGARPAVGKSAYVTQITSNLAKQGKRVGFYSLEMQEKQVYERFVVSQSGIGLTRLRRAKKFLG